MQKPTRRQYVALLGTTALTGGYALTRAEPADAQATVAPDALDVPDVEAATEGQTITAVTLTVNAEWSWNASHRPDSVTLELLSGDQESTMEPIDTRSLPSDTTSESGETELVGDVTSGWQFSTTDFEPSGDTPVSRAVWCGVKLTVKRQGDVLAESEVVDVCRVTVDGSPLEATATLTGTGTINVETDA